MSSGQTVSIAKLEIVRKKWFIVLSLLVYCREWFAGSHHCLLSAIRTWLLLLVEVALVASQC